MSTNEEFIDTFKQEAQEYLETIESSLLDLEKDYSDSEAIDNIFRAMHSLKGGGAMFGFSHINDFTHQMESLYEGLRSGGYSMSDEIISLTFRSVDILRSLIENDDKLIDREPYSNTLSQIKSLLNQEPKPQKKQEKKDKASKDVNKTYYIYFSPAADTLDSGTNPLYLLDELMNMGEGFIFARLDHLPDIHQLDPTKCYLFWEIILVTTSSGDDIREVFLFVEDESDIAIEELAQHNLLETKNIDEKLKNLKHNQPLPLDDIKKSVKEPTAEVQKRMAPGGSADMQSIKVASDKIDKLINVVGEMVTFESQLSMLAMKLQNSELDEVRENFEKLTTRLREVTFDISLVPLSSVFLRFRRLVRDLSAEQGKDVNFATEGEETQLDKTIIEHLNEPVLHILRNSISHGIESEEERKKMGKNARGELRLKAYYSGPEVHIDISDDGRGFDLEKIRKQAIRRGVISAQAAPSEQELLELTFQSGFTTTSKVDGVSGRGVGMDVIRNRLSEINGDVSIQSEKGKGSVITLIIPLTLSIVDGLLVKVNDLYFIIPLSVINRIETIKAESLQKQNQIVSFQGESIPFAPMFFDLSEKEYDKDQKFPVIIVEHHGRKYGFVVHEVLDNNQVVLKPLGKYLKGFNVFSGGCLLGDGTIAYVVDIRKFIEYKSDILNPNNSRIILPKFRDD